VFWCSISRPNKKWLILLLTQRVLDSASRSCRALAHAATSVIGRLHARSLTGQSLHFHVHQHYSYRLHVTWPIQSRRTTIVHCGIERRFATYASVSDFCDGLRILDILCTCLSVQWFSNHLQGKSDCYSSPCQNSSVVLSQVMNRGFWSTTPRKNAEVGIGTLQTLSVPRKRE
jgi:hypothetical protein